MTESPWKPDCNAPAEPGPTGIPLARPVELVSDRDLPRNSLRLEDITRLTAGRNLVLVVALGATLVLWAGLVEEQIGGAQGWVTPQWARLIATLAAGLVMAGFVLLLTRASGLRFRALGLHGSAPFIQVVWGVAALGMAFTALVASGLVLWLVWPEAVERMNRNPECIKEMVPQMSAGALLAVCAAVGLYEEVLFRGFLLTNLRRLTGSWTAAVVLNSLLFALLHGYTQEPVTILRLFPIAVIWSVITIWRRALLPAIVAHALFDLVQLLFVFYVLPGMQKPGGADALGLLWP